MLPASIQVCPVELPGRGRRQGDAAINDVSRLADVLVESLPLQVRCPAACHASQGPGSLQPDADNVWV